MKHWTDAEKALLSANAGLPRAELLALFPDRHPDAVQSQRHRMGLAGPSQEWTAEEDAILRASTALTSPEIVAQGLVNRSLYSVRIRRKKLNLERPKAGCYREIKPKQFDAPVSYVPRPWQKPCGAIHTRSDGTVFRCNAPTELRRGLCVTCVAHFSRLARAA